jgi:hypothetical protein
MRLLALGLALALSACAAPSFVANTGRVTPQGAFRVGFGSGYQVNTSAADVVRDGRDLARSLDSKRVSCPNTTATLCWNRADVEPVVDAAYRFALVAPLSTHTEFSVRYGFADGFDFGLRLGPDSKGLDFGWQFLGSRDPRIGGWGGTVLAGFGQRSFGTLGDVIESVFQGDATLSDYEVKVVTGYQWREIAHAYVGARYTLTHWTLQVIPDLPIIYADGGDAQQRLLGTDPSGNLHAVGAVFGGALGYRYLFVGAELNVIQTFGSARVLFADRSFSGLGLMPALYLYGQY